MCLKQQPTHAVAALTTFSQAQRISLYRLWVDAVRDSVDRGMRIVEQFARTDAAQSAISASVVLSVRSGV